MNNKAQIQKQVEETLASLDRVTRASANPFLYTRIKARLEAEEHSIWQVAASWLTRPAVVVAAFLIVVFMNAWVFLPAGTTTETATVQDADQQLAREYTLVATSDETLYSITNEEQP